MRQQLSLLQPDKKNEILQTMIFRLQRVELEVDVAKKELKTWKIEIRI